MISSKVATTLKVKSYLAYFHMSITMMGKSILDKFMF